MCKSYVLTICATDGHEHVKYMYASVWVCEACL